MSFRNEIWLAIRADKPDGEGGGTPADPYAVNTPSSFAATVGDISKVPANSIIRLGPGVFRTRGAGGNGVTSVPAGSLWFPLSGQKLIGSGMFATTLQFDWDIVPTGVPGPRHFMIRSAEYLKSYELSDLTLDCNLQNTPFGKDPVISAGPITARLYFDSYDVLASAAFFTVEMIGKIAYFEKNPFTFSGKIENVSADGLRATLDRMPAQDATGASLSVFYPRFSVTAVSLIGENIRVRRVRCINFGTRTPLYFDGESEKSGQTKSAEGFPLRIEGRTLGLEGGDAPAFNSWLEECVVEQPYPFSAREVTFVVGGGAMSHATPPQKLHLEPFGLGIRNCYLNFEFVNPGPGQPVPIGGIAYSGSAPNVDATVATRFPVFVAPGDYVEMSGNDPTALDGRFQVTAVGPPDPSHKLVLTFTIRIGTNPGPPAAFGVAFKSAKPTLRAALGRYNGTVTVTTATPHNRDDGDYVSVFGADQPEYNGTWPIARISGAQFSYQLPSGANPDTPATASGSLAGKEWQTGIPLDTSQVSLEKVHPANSRPRQPYPGGMWRAALRVAAVFVFVFYVISSSHGQTNTFIVPRAMEAAFGNASFRPFQNGTVGFYQLYASNLFSELPTDTIAITEMAFRVDESGSSDLRSTVLGLFLGLNVFRGSIEEAIKLNGFQAPRIAVFDSDIVLQGRAGHIDAFDLRIPFQRPYAYDRRKGYLVAAFGRDGLGDKVVMDALGVILQEGFALSQSGFGDRTSYGGVLSTKFTYFLPPQILHAEFLDDIYHLTFSFSGDLAHLTLESGPAASGPFTPVDDAILESVRIGEGSASLAISKGKQYFRLRQTYP